MINAQVAAPSPRTQAGQSATELLVIFPVMVILVFGIIQFALLYQTRAVLNHATFLAARAAALNGGSQAKMRAALAKGLTPLFASEATVKNFGTSLIKANLEASNLYTSIEVLNPTTAAMNDFGQPSLKGGTDREIPNDTLNYRKTTPGASSKISIQDANIVHIRVTYCARLIVPVIDRILFAATNAKTQFNSSLTSNGMTDAFGTWDQPLLPNCKASLVGARRIHVQSEAFVRMQTPFERKHLPK